MQVDIGDDSNRQRKISVLNKAMAEEEEWVKIYKQQVRELGEATYNIRRKCAVLRKRCCAKWRKLFPDKYNLYDDDFLGYVLDTNFSLCAGRTTKRRRRHESDRAT